MHRREWLARALSGAVGLGALQTRAYKIIAGESNLWVYVAKGGLLSAFAHNHHIGVKAFTGQVSVPAGGASGGALTLDIEAPSLAVLDEKISDKDRAEISNSLHTVVLASDKHAKITFKSVAVGEVKAQGGDGFSFTLQGDLTLRGVAKRIAVPVTATITPQAVTASGQYTLRQSLFGIKPYAAAGGTVKVKDDVVVHFKIVAKS